MSVASSFEQQMLELINVERVSFGLDPLRLEQRLNDSAEDHSTWMLDEDVFSHTGVDGSSSNTRMRNAGFEFEGSWASGENIAWQSERGSSGISDDVADLHEALMNSEGHRANILNPNYDYVGIGIETGYFYAQANNGNWYNFDAVMVTQNFAATTAEVVLDPYSGGDAPVAESSEPDPEVANVAPEVTAESVVLAPVAGSRTVSVQDILSVDDPDDATVDQFELRDASGKQNFRMKGVGALDARDGVVIDADDLELLRIVSDDASGDQALWIRAYDGTDWGEWETFTLTTVDSFEFA